MQSNEDPVQSKINNINKIIKRIVGTPGRSLYSVARLGSRTKCHKLAGLNNTDFPTD